MQYKLLFLVVIFAIVLQSIASDSTNRKSSKTNKDENEVVSLTTTKKKTNRVNDDDDDDNNNRSQGSFDRREGFSPFGPSSNNYRSRSRGPSSSSMYNNYDDVEDWSPYGMGSNYPHPLPPSAYETGPYLGNNGPNCFPLLDPQYPFFSDLCGAVPQARYALPNAFGHIERWQIAQALGAILGPMSPASANPVCTRSLRLLICPLLFPPCPTKYEARPVLPCQPFCRIVKTQCAAPGLELLPCDLLPPTSDLCPINPAPYSSLLSSFIPPLPPSGPMFPPGLPPNVLSALLAQSAMASGVPPPSFLPGPGMFPPMGVPPPSFLPGPGMLPPTGAIPPPTGAIPPKPTTGPLTPSVASSPTSALTPTPFPSVLPGIPFASMMNQADPSSSGLASMLAASGMSPMFPGDSSSSGLASMLAASGMSQMFPGDPSSPLSSLLAQSAFASGLPQPGLSQMLSPMNPFFGSQSLLADTLTPIFVDFPPLQFGAGGAPLAASRYFPRLRSATAEEA